MFIYISKNAFFFGHSLPPSNSTKNESANFVNLLYLSTKSHQSRNNGSRVNASQTNGQTIVELELELDFVRLAVSYYCSTKPLSLVRM